MFSLRGLFPPLQKDPKKNFIKENVKQVRNLQNTRQLPNNSRLSTIKHEKNAPKREKVHAPSLSNELTDTSQNSQSSSFHAKVRPPDAPAIRKADMNEFLRRKMIRDTKPPPAPVEEYFKQSTDNVARHKDVGCQYTEPDTTHFFADGTKLRVIYPTKKSMENLKDTTDTSRIDAGDKRHVCIKEHSRPLKKCEQGSSTKIVQSRYLSNERCNENVGETDRSAYSLSSMLPHETQDKNIKSALGPPRYQRGVIPKYIKEMKHKAEQKEEKCESNEFSVVDPHCPAGHIALPESERVETLRILKEKVTELVGELNKMPVRTDTLRMKNRKMQLDKELAKLEEGIKVFSRPKVYVNVEV